MKAARFVLIVIFALGVIASVCGMSFAENGKYECKVCKENDESAIKVLQDSAAALEKSNPDLAKGLNDYANEKAKIAREWKKRKERHEARMKLLTDSAAALEKTNPDLAKPLKEMSERKHDKKMREMKKEENEEEMGEKAEPKEEQSGKQ